MYNEINLMSVAIEMLSKSKRKCFKGNLKKQCRNISILLWQKVSVVLDHLQSSVQI